MESATEAVCFAGSADNLGVEGNQRRIAQLNLIAGMGSGAFCKVIEYPFDTVKVLLQSDPNKYKGPLDCLTQTYKQ